jgi:hypothetical protein
MLKFPNLANEQSLKELAISVGFMMNEPSDLMNDGAEFAFLPKMTIKVLQSFISFLFSSFSFFFLFSLVR